ncbi:STAS domain-containing protein [Streptomyces sp. WG-D5]
MNTPPSPAPFTLTAVDAGVSVLLRVNGELDLDTAPALDEALTSLHTRHCELDLAEVPFTDSTGINLLLRHHREAAEAGGSLRVVSVTRPVRRVLDISGLSATLLSSVDPSSPHPDNAQE